MPPSSPPFRPLKRGRQAAGTCEIACHDEQLTQVEVIPALVGGSAYKNSLRNTRSAGRRSLKGGADQHVLTDHFGYGVFVGYAFMNRTNVAAAFHRVTEERKT